MWFKVQQDNYLDNNNLEVDNSGILVRNVEETGQKLTACHKQALAKTYSAHSHKVLD